MSKQRQFSYGQALGYSLVLHIAVFGFFLFNSHPTPKEITATPSKSASKPIIEAVSIDERMVMEQVHRRRQEKLAADIRQQKQKAQAAKQQQRLQQQIKQTQLAQQQAKASLKQLQNRLASQRQSAKQQQRQLEKLKKQHAKANQSLQATQKNIADSKKRARELARMRVRREAAEKRAKAEAELRELSLKNNRGEIDRYAVLIKQSISRSWILPKNANKSLSSRFQVTLAPSGDVLDVRLLTASGNTALDRAAKLAIYKASPLPVPGDPDLFTKFKVFNITMRPEKVVAAI